MPAVEFARGSASRGPPAVFSGCEADRSVVWLRGAHDTSTVVALCMTVARAIALEDADLVIDLSEVTCMDATTVEVMVRAEARIRRSACGRFLTLLDARRLGNEIASLRCNSCIRKDSCTTLHRKKESSRFTN